MVWVTNSANGLPCPSQIYLDDYEEQILKDFYEKVKNDWDGIIIVTGREGSGKSTYAMQRALYLDPSFRLDRIVFNNHQFEKAVLKAKPFSVIMYDEADDSTGYILTKGVRQVIRMMKTIRDHHLIIIMVTPTFFDMNKYFAIHRTELLIHVYSRGLERGFFRLFNYNKKKLLYLKGKKTWDMGVVKANLGDSFPARFKDLPSDFPINKHDYVEKKHKGLQGEESDGEALGEENLSTEKDYLKSVSTPAKAVILKRLLTMAKLNGWKINRDMLGYVLGISGSYTSQLLKRLKFDKEISGFVIVEGADELFKKLSKAEDEEFVFVKRGGQEKLEGWLEG